MQPHDQERTGRSPRRAGEALDITIAWTTGARTLQFRVPKYLAVVAVSAVALCILVSIAAAVLFGQWLKEIETSNQLRNENLHMRRQLAQVGELEGWMAQIDSTRRALLQLVGVEEPPVDPVLEARTKENETGSIARGYRRVEPGGRLAEGDLETILGELTYVPLSGPLTRCFGPVGEPGVFHTGTDIAGETGTAVLAAGEGVVSFVGSEEIFGQVIVVAHRHGIETMYGHNDQVFARVGDFVSGGQQIATVGNTGISTAPHLHFEVHWGGKAVDPSLVFSEWQVPNSPLDADSSEASY